MAQPNQHKSKSNDLLPSTQSHAFVFVYILLFMNPYFTNIVRQKIRKVNKREYATITGYHESICGQDLFTLQLC